MEKWADVVNLSLERLRKNSEFKVSLGYVVRLYLKQREVGFRSLTIKIHFIDL